MLEETYVRNWMLSQATELVTALNHPPTHQSQPLTLPALFQLVANLIHKCSFKLALLSSLQQTRQQQSQFQKQSLLEEHQKKQQLILEMDDTIAELEIKLALAKEEVRGVRGREEWEGEERQRKMCWGKVMYESCPTTTADGRQFLFQDDCKQYYPQEHQQSVKGQNSPLS